MNKTSRVPHDATIPTDTTDLMFTVTCADKVFGSPCVNDGSYLTLDKAIEGAVCSKARNPQSTSRYRIHLNRCGYGYVDSPEVLSLLF